jgi:energy-coupling factor transporter ATP-binding protein EcfA2
MSNLTIEIDSIKSIKNFKLEIPIEQGLHVIAGSNGVGKSTIMALLAAPFRKTMFETIFSNTNKNGRVSYSYDNANDVWNRIDGKWVLDGKKNNAVKIDGFIEGSVIHGTRFSDANVLNISETVLDEHLVDADEFINENFNFVLHGKKFYPTIRKIRNTKTAVELGFKSVPYFVEYDGKKFSQFWLSSGENLLLSLLHFLNNKIFQQKKKGSKVVSLILIDEVELALHPVAISRLVQLLTKLSKEYNLSIYFSSHSTELLRAISPKNIYFLQSLPNGTIEVINPCYPAYATRFLYNQDGYDILILPEDELAKFVIDKIIVTERLYSGKLYHILPCGDWRNTVRMHKEIIESNLTSHSTKVISVLDGDIETDYEAEKIKAPDLKKLNVAFLPIPSLEKFLHKNLIESVDAAFFRDVNDRFFRKKSLDEVISEYQANGLDKKGKKLWNAMIKSLSDDGMKENEFLREICGLIYQKMDAKGLTARIQALF